MKEDQIEWQKMIKGIQTCGELKYGCRLSDWEIARLEEWSKLRHLSDAQGAIVERIYKEKCHEQRWVYNGGTISIIGRVCCPMQNGCTVDGRYAGSCYG